MKLLEIGPDLLSLEYTPGEAVIVTERLGRLGRVSVERCPTHELIRVAGEEFLRENEWDEPCLIARSAAGSALLRFVAAGSRDLRLAS